VQSQPGAGATFQVSLPIAPDVVATPHLPAARKAQRDFEVLRNRSVLVVDDEESIREIVHEGLSARGLKVDCAESSEAALELLTAHAYDVVLCDFNLPGLDGDELFEQVRQQSSPPVFVFMSGDLLEQSRAAEFEQNGAHFLQKPFHVAALASLLLQILDPQTAPGVFDDPQSA
jgi:CheY-like chemotaxis protein